jgi:serine/threonine protein kinase
MTRRKLTNSPFSEKESLEIAKNILETIKYLQNSGICHRDIKP